MRSNLWGLILASAFLHIGFSSPGNASDVSERFETALAKACEAQESQETCSCYAKRVTEKYDDTELVSIFNLLQDQEANSMFLVIHAKDGQYCAQQVNQ